MTPRPLRSTLFPYTTLFRSECRPGADTVPPPNFLVGVIDDRMADLVTKNRLANAGAVFFVVEFCRVYANDDDLIRSEEHTSELQSRQYLVCRLLLEKKKKRQ